MRLKSLIVTSNVGSMYTFGQVVTLDYGKAAEWYRKSATQGNSYAQNSLGAAYESGQGIPLDRSEAAKWYELAADQGNSYAQFNLARLYFNGEGVQPDLILAHHWYSLAAAGLPASDTTRKVALESNQAIVKLLSPDQLAKSFILTQQWKAAHGKND